jgi:hypothetical protein
MQALDELIAQVETTIGAEASAIVLITGLSTAIKDVLQNGATPADLDALRVKLNKSAADLAAAVAANPVPAGSVPPVPTGFQPLQG